MSIAPAHANADRDYLVLSPRDTSIRIKASVQLVRASALSTTANRVDANLLSSVPVGGLNLTFDFPTKNAYTLDELLAGITDDNLHGEISTGAPMGDEAW